MKKNKKGGWKRVVLILLCIILFLILAAVVAVVLYVNSLLGNIQRVEGTVPTLTPEEIQQIEEETEPEDVEFTGPVMDVEEVTWATEPVEVIGEEEDHIINILLIGQDRREGEGRQRSDSMILCTINTKTNTLTMTSFLRDLYVQIPGHKDNRLNAAYAFGGMPLLNECLERNFGVHVDGNIEVDFSGFSKIVDIMGGVDIHLTAKEAAWLNSGNPDWNLREGTNHLDGEQSLAYSRIRKIDNDFGRTNRQRKVLNILIQKGKKMSFSRVNDLLQSVTRLITTDLTNKEITDYVIELFPMLSDVKIETQYIPADGTYKSVKIEGKAVLLPDLEANRKILQETLLGD